MDLSRLKAFSKTQLRAQLSVCVTQYVKISVSERGMSYVVVRAGVRHMIVSVLLTLRHSSQSPDGEIRDSWPGQVDTRLWSPNASHLLTLLYTNLLR